MPHLPGKDNKPYWDAVEKWAHDFQSDGCTGVKDIYIKACWEHDFHCRYAVTMFGEPITLSETNTRFRQVIQMLSKLRWFSPISWVRYTGVSVFGPRIWSNWRALNLTPPSALPSTMQDT